MLFITALRKMMALWGSVLKLSMGNKREVEWRHLYVVIWIVFFLFTIFISILALLAVLNDIARVYALQV